MLKKRDLVFVCLVWVFFLSATACSAGESPEILGRKVVTTALSRLDAGPGDDLACLTSAGFAHHKGQATRGLYDGIAKYFPVSIGKGTLLAVHCRPDDPLWFAFLHRRDKTHLLMVYVTIEDGRVSASRPMNIYVAKHQSFEPFKAVLGKRTFSIITLANGWANKMPMDLMAGACFHDHFCCGVATGYFTARFITGQLPLAKGEQYAYIGAPAWCQDDYLLYHLNLTPGKHGYYTMAYPWSRAWNTDKRRFKHLGGIVIRFNETSGRGRADLLGFDWRWEDFKAFLGEPDLKLDWKHQPWLHVWYNRYLFQQTGLAGRAVSVVKSRDLESRAERDALVRLGANPLAVMLGRDAAW